MAKPKKAVPTDIRLVLEPELADRVRDSAARGGRTLHQEVRFQLRRIYLAGSNGEGHANERAT